MGAALVTTGRLGDPLSVAAAVAWVWLAEAPPFAVVPWQAADAGRSGAGG